MPIRSIDVLSECQSLPQYLSLLRNVDNKSTFENVQLQHDKCVDDDTTEGHIHARRICHGTQPAAETPGLMIVAFDIAHEGVHDLIRWHNAIFAQAIRRWARIRIFSSIST